MQREVVWQALEEPALEHIVVSEQAHGAHHIDSTVTGLIDGAPFALRYRIECDLHWRVRSLTAEVPHGRASIELQSNGEGIWTTGSPDLDETLAGCIDVDIIVTPFTNTLPIRRLGLEVGSAAEIDVLYMVVPALEVSNRRQRYTRLAGRTYRFESIEGGQTVFSAELNVDDEGLVIDYPGLFKRLYPAAAVD